MLTILTNLQQVIMWNPIFAAQHASLAVSPVLHRVMDEKKIMQCPPQECLFFFEKEKQTAFILQKVAHKEVTKGGGGCVQA